MIEPQHIRSRDNPLLVQLRKLVQDGAAYRRTGQVWLEGEHLCGALRGRGVMPLRAVISEEGWQQPRLRALCSGVAQVSVMAAPLFAGISTLASPAMIGLLIATQIGRAHV